MGVKKKILLVNDLLVAGGVEKLLYDFVWHWHEKYDITVLTYQYCGNTKEIYPENVKYLSASVKKEYKNNIIEKIYNKFHKKIYSYLFQKKLNHMKFDVAIAMKEGWITQKVDKIQAIKKYSWVHTDYNNFYYTNVFFDTPEEERKCMQRFNHVICVSEDIAKGIKDVIGDPGNLKVLYNPIDVQNVIGRSKESIDDIGEKTEDGRVRFVTVGRLHFQKGYDILLEACHMLEKDGLQFEVLIVGGEEPWSEEHNRLYRAQKRMNIQSVKFLGGRKNPYKYIKCADWFLSSSIFEGYSLVSQEAAVLGIPLVLTGCSGVRELLGDSEYGIIIKDISALGIYETMKRIIQNPELHQYYKEKIIERRKIINFEGRIRAIEELIE